MSVWDATKQVGQLVKDFVLLTERLDKLQKLVEKQGDLISDLRKENGKLITEVAVLKEARNTIDAQVEATLTRTIAKWRVDDLEAQNKALREKQLPPPEQQS